jgi:protein involved in polysaccharide export with SLBB domain
MRAVCLTLLALLIGCRHSLVAHPAKSGPPVPKAAVSGGYDGLWVIHPGARLYILSFAPPPFHLELERQVKEDGTITLLSNQVFAAAGKTIPELEKEIEDFYRPGIRTNMIIHVYGAPKRFYSVQGQVVSPGRQILMDGTTVAGAIQAAGGFCPYASRSRVQVKRSGATYRISYNKALKNPGADMEVLANDQIFVPRSLWGKFLEGLEE